jgi:small-conductance mechanosensitive channel
MNGQPTTISVFTFGNLLLLVGSIAGISILLRCAGHAFESVSSARPRTRFLFRVAETTLKILLWCGAFSFAMRLFAPNQSALVVILGAAAVAVGFGARDLIKNLIGGLVIIVDRPYEIGDRVKIDDASGTIQRIGFRSTKMTTPDGALLTVPNSKLLDGIAQNDSAGTPECLVAAEVLLHADADPDLALRVGREALITCPYLSLRRPTEITLVDKLSQMPYMSLKLKAYVYDHRFESQMRTDLVRRCKAEFNRLGVVHDHPATHASNETDPVLATNASRATPSSDGPSSTSKR